MTIYVALLRGVNVGGHRKVSMTDLRDLLQRMGFVDPQSLGQSGNLIFKGTKEASAHLERLLEAEAGKRLGLKTDFIVRTSDEWKAAIAHNPFRKEAASDPAHLLVMFLKQPSDKKGVQALRNATAGPEIFHIEGKQGYIVYPRGIAGSRLTTALIDRKLGTQSTGRNWNTVLKIAALTNA